MIGIRLVGLRRDHPEHVFALAQRHSQHRANALRIAKVNRLGLRVQQISDEKRFAFFENLSA